MYRAVSIESVAGLTEIRVPGVENLDVSDEFSGHMGYRKAMPRLLFTSGVPVTEQEFEEPESDEDGDGDGYAALNKTKRGSSSLDAHVSTENAMAEQTVEEMRQSGVEVKELQGTLPTLVLEHVEYKRQVELATWKKGS